MSSCFTGAGLRSSADARIGYWLILHEPVQANPVVVVASLHQRRSAIRIVVLIAQNFCPLTPQIILPCCAKRRGCHAFQTQGIFPDECQQGSFCMSEQSRHSADCQSRACDSVALRCLGAALMNAAASLVSAPAFADPSITYTGSVSPAPEQGVTSWTPDGTLTIGDADGNSGALSIAGGATVSARTFLFLYNGTLKIDGVGSEFNSTSLLSTGSNPIETNSYVIIVNGKK